MKSKLLSLVFLFALVSLLTLALVSAQISVTTGTEVLTKSKNTTYFIIKNTNMTADTIVNIGSFGNMNDSNSHVLTLVTSGNGNNIVIANNTSYRVNVSYTSTASNFDYGSFSSSLNITEGSTITTIPLTFTSSYCSFGQVSEGDLDLDIEYEVKTGFGEDDEWYPLDKIEVTVNVENNANEDLEDLTMEWCLYDEKAKKCVLEDEADTFDLDEDDDIDVTFTIDLDADELNSNNEDYTLIIKVYGDNQNELCREETEKSIKIIIEKNFVVVDGLEYSDSATCDSFFDIRGKAWNIGSKDQDDVYLNMYNRELGLNQRVELGDIDSFDSKTFNTQIKIPGNATDKTYSVLVSVYDKDDDIYESNKGSDDKTSDFAIPVKVEGCKKQSASITAELSSETPKAVIGRQVIVEATIKNTGNTATTYTVDITGNSEWSSLADIDPKTITLNAGESKRVDIYLDIDSDAEAGDKEFTIKTNQGEQKVRITLEKTSLPNFFKNYWLELLLGLVCLILLIAIIIVVVSIARKSD